MDTCTGLLQLVRPHNIAAAAMSVAAGFMMAGSAPPPWPLLLAAAVSVSAGNTINDYFDRDIDRVNKPGRPIPSGRLSARTVLVLYAAQVLLLAVLCPLLSAPSCAWLAAWVILLFVYSSLLKRLYLAGNLLVSAVASSGFLLGSMSGGAMEAGLPPALLSFPFVLGRELVKDVEDLEGDRACGARTLPAVSGRRTALRLAAILFALLAAAFPVPGLAGMYGPAYLAVMLATVVPILVLCAALSLADRRIRTVSILLKIAMFFGILAFYLGSRG